MAINPNELHAFQKDFEAATGESWQGFFCPITYEHGIGEGLMDGHILPEKIKKAVRTTVIQRSDVDNKFGSTVEPALIDFVNSLKYTKEEILNKAKSVTVTTDDGAKADTFVASPKASPPFPKVGLLDDGKVIGSPHVRISPEDLGAKGQLQVEGRMEMSASACTCTMLKAAHLAMFKLMGYRYIFEPHGELVGRQLAAFLNDLDPKSNAAQYFAKFEGCWNFISGDNFPFETLRDRRVLIHTESKAGPFGMSCAFKMNDKTFIVTTPFCPHEDRVAVALDCYDRYLRDRAMLQTMFVADLPAFGTMEIGEQFHMQYTEHPPERYS